MKRVNHLFLCGPYIREVPEACGDDGVTLDDVILLVPPKAQQEAMREAMEVRAAKERE